MIIDQIRTAHQKWNNTIETPVNNVIFNSWYYGHPVSGSQYPWCAVYQSYIWIREAGGTLDFLGFGAHGSAGCAMWVSAYRRIGRFGSTPHVGDHVFYGPGGSTHIEWVDGVQADGIWTWGGNTGQGSYNNGGQVCRQFRKFGGAEPIYGYGSPIYSQEQDMTSDEHAMLTQAHDAIARMEGVLANVVGAVSDIQSRIGNVVQPDVEEIKADATLIAPKNP